MRQGKVNGNNSIKYSTRRQSLYEEGGNPTEGPADAGSSPGCGVGIAAGSSGPAGLTPQLSCRARQRGPPRVSLGRADREPTELPGRVLIAGNHRADMS